MMSAPLALDAPARPILHLSGERLRSALASLIKASEPVGGVERFAAAVKLKGEIIRDRLVDPDRIEQSGFHEVARLMPTVRRRIGGLIDGIGWPRVLAAMAELLANAQAPGSADARMAAFERALSAPSPRTRGEGRGEGQALAPESTAAPFPIPEKGMGKGGVRFLRDLAAEILHGVHPETYPLMTRWVWDARTNTGVLRDIWHDPVSGGATDGIIIDVPDTHETFLVLREELSQFLSGQGVYRDVPWYVDLIEAHVYAGYINAQGGVYLKTDFASEGDPLEHTRRILGLDKKAVGSRQ